MIYTNHFSIHNDYVIKLHNHLKEKEGDKNHKFYCSIHTGLIDLARGQIRNNIATIAELKTEIKELLS